MYRRPSIRRRRERNHSRRASHPSTPTNTAASSSACADAQSRARRYRSCGSSRRVAIPSLATTRSASRYAGRPMISANVTSSCQRRRMAQSTRLPHKMRAPRQREASSERLASERLPDASRTAFDSANSSLPRATRTAADSSTAATGPSVRPCCTTNEDARPANVGDARAGGRAAGASSRAVVVRSSRWAVRDGEDARREVGVEERGCC